MRDTLMGYTRDAAYAIGRETHSGQLKAGFDADLAIFSGNPLKSLDDTEVSATMMGGEWTYDRSTRFS